MSDKNNPQVNAKSPQVQASLDRYWKWNLLVMRALLLVWAVAGLGCGVLFADYLNKLPVKLGGFPLGFWFAQQGAIIVFVLIILLYCVLMNALDRKHHNELESLKNGSAEN
ncbi:MAG: DUF4212 domain-containing protein [Phycisphaera sp.]|nr:DUF4212 domain-containing protein [Phycisphaera sp.]